MQTTFLDAAEGARACGAGSGPPLAALEAWAIAEALRQSHGNKSLAALILGISRDTLYRKLHDLGFDSELSDSPKMSDSRT